MQTVSLLVPKLKQKLSNPFVRNVGWLGLSEMTLRVLRLGVVVVLARHLNAQDYGLAAIVLSVNEFARVFMDVGCSAKLIQAEESEVSSLANSVYWLNWTLLSCLFVVQCLAAFPIAWFYNNNQLIWPICVAALPNLINPLGSVQLALIQRENRLKNLAITNTVFNGTSFTLSAVFAFLGFGMWSIVLPGVVATPIGIYLFRRFHPWRATSRFTTQHWGTIFSFGKNILGVQLLRVLRNNLDYLVVGRLIGIQELGIYFFGFNAGLGISLSVINALNSAILPHLCSARADWSNFRKSYLSSLKVIALVIVSLVTLQTTLAPWYVPLVFGQKWVVAIPILILICLSAIPRPFADAASQLMVAIGKPNLDLRWNILFTGIFTTALLIGAQWQAIGVATAVLLVHIVCLPLYSLWATRYVFPKTQVLADPALEAVNKGE